MKKYKAYILIETSLSILMLGISLVIILSYSKYSLYKIQKNETKCKANYIRKAIEGYVARHGMMPSAGNEDGEEVEGLYKGFVPYKALGISKIYKNDGFNKSFVYFVNPNFVLSEYKDCIVLPVYFPQNVYPSNASDKRIVCFQRLYQEKQSLNEKKFLKKYIYLDEFKYKNLSEYEMTEKNIIIRNCYVNEDRHIEFFQKHIVKDCIVWSIVPSNSASYKDNEFKFNRDVFWQSRFNIASMLNCPSTNDTFDVSVIYNEDDEMPVELDTYKEKNSES